jgi:hypothetical protein
MGRGSEKTHDVALGIGEQRDTQAVWYVHQSRRFPAA